MYVAGPYSITLTSTCPPFEWLTKGSLFGIEKSYAGGLERFCGSPAAVVRLYRYERGDADDKKALGRYTWDRALKSASDAVWRRWSIHPHADDFVITVF
jgi:hypothetical protein